MYDVQTADDAPWKLRFRVSPIQAQIATANPDRGLVSNNRTGKFELFAWDVPSGDLTQLTDRPDGTAHGQISPDGRYVFYLDDREGDETGNFVRIPFEGGEPQSLTPGLPPYSAFSGAMDATSTYFGIGIPGPEGFACYVTPLDGSTVGEPRLLHLSPTITHGPVFAPVGLAIWQVARPGKLSFGLLAFELESGEQVGELWDGDESSVELTPAGAGPGDRGVLVTSNQSGSKRPLLWSPRTGDSTPIAIGDLQGDIEGLAWSPDGTMILLCRTFRAEQHLYLFHVDGEQLSPLNAPTGTYSEAHILSGGDIAIQWQDSTHPSGMIVLDGMTGEKSRDLLLPGAVPDGNPWRSISFDSSDGTSVQAWLATPEGDGPFPTILETHGGPTTIQRCVFLPRSQAWLDHGFAYCTVNYRGSPSFGREYEQAIWGNLGHWEVEDMVAARKHLVAEGIADPAAVIPIGRSYGGYLTLHALGTHPDLWAAGVAEVVVADWVSQYEDESDALRGYDIGLFGGTLEEKREQYVRSSPITYLEDLVAPVLIIQGRADTRDPPRQVELYEAKARRLNKPVEVEWFDTGHSGSITDRELGITHQELALQFVRRVLHSPQ